MDECWNAHHLMGTCYHKQEFQYELMEDESC